MRTLARFLFPRRTARAVPFGRLSILVQLVAVVIFLGYILINTGVRPPFVSDPYELEVAFSDASGLDEDNRPTVAVAGIEAGRVVEVRLVDGRAIATLELDADARDRVYRDASAEIRPINAINQLVVNVDPGSPSAGALPDGGQIAAERTSTHVGFDRVLEVFDADTRAFLQIAITEAERALRGRGGELRAGLAELGELSDPATEVAGALADRRRLLARLVEDLDGVFSELATRDDRLASVVAAGGDTLATTAANERRLRETLRALPPMLASARAALAGGRELAEPLVPALDGLTRATEPLPEALRETRALLPEADALLSDLDLLVRDGREPVRTLASVARQLEPTAAAARRPVRRLIPVLEELDRRKQGVTQTTELLSGVFSTSDANGVRFRIVTFPEEPRPENFGLPAAAARSSGDGPSELDRKLAQALGGHCRAGDSRACALRESVPGLPAVSGSQARPRGAADRPARRTELDRWWEALTWFAGQPEQEATP